MQIVCFTKKKRIVSVHLISGILVSYKLGCLGEIHSLI